jgi:hypothetical protein
MEKSEKRKDIRNYIQLSLNPIIEPMVKEIVRNRPNDIYTFIQQYATQKI